MEAKKRILTLLVTIIFMIGLVGIVYAGAIYDGTITVSTTAQGFSSSVPETAKKALVTLSGCDAYFSVRSAPTITAGHKLLLGDALILDNYHDIKTFQVIVTSACSATTTTLYYTIFD